MGAYFEDGTIGHNYWLENRKLVGLLAVMVHRESPDLIPEPAAAPAGGTRRAQRQVQAESVAQERHAARLANQDEEDVQFKRAKLAATRGMVIEQQNRAISSQLDMFFKFRDTYMDQEDGDAAYASKVQGLLNNLPDPINGGAGHQAANEEANGE